MHSDWHALGEVQYRKWTVYEPMQWELGFRFEEYVICGASFGGPIAMVRDQGRLALGEAKGETPPSYLKVFSSSGLNLAEVFDLIYTANRINIIICMILL